MWVVKVGGSLAGADHLPRWLEVLAVEGRGRAAIVPGGGPFADQVRRMQARLGFDDPSAHHMALLAMEQYAVMLRALQPDLVPVVSVADTRRALEQGRTAIWMPTALVLAECALSQSWEVTSDSLAAWFAAALGATYLALIKSVPLPRQTPLAQSLERDGLVDPLFPKLVARSRFTTLLLGPSDTQRLQALLRADTCGVAGAV